VPYPANYGGVIDVFYKIKNLHEAGVKIYLHCFEYGREHSVELEKYCETVHYYHRKTGFSSNLSRLPYTVKSRASEELAENLLKNDFPILFEVLHTCFLLDDERFKKRIKIYRHSNIEHEYYKHLAKGEKNKLKKAFLKIEARRLKKFESIVEHADLILAVNTADLTYFKTHYPKVKSEYLPSFHPHNSVNSKEGKGDYILYHANLSISENYLAAEWLIRNVFSKINFPVKIAGLNPPSHLISLINQHKNIVLIENPNDAEMQKLVEEAHIHTLFTQQATGLKLKLLNVLYAGRFVICNNEMLAGTEFKSDKALVISNTPTEFSKAIEDYFTKSFGKEELQQRTQLVANFDNKKNTQKLLGLINS
jgi:hypothetical protein